MAERTEYGPECVSLRLLRRRDCCRHHSCECSIGTSGMQAQYSCFGQDGRDIQQREDPVAECADQRLFVPFGCISDVYKRQRLVCGGVKWDTGTKQYLAAPAAADLVINHSGQILSTEDTQVAVFYLTPCSPADLLTDLTGTGGTPGLTLTADVAKDIN